VIGDSVARFTGSVAQYELDLREEFHKAAERLDRIGIHLTEKQFSEILETKAVLSLIGSTVDSLFQAISDAALLLLIVLFMLLEAHGFPAKLRRALGRPEDGLVEFQRASSQVYRYLALKALFGVLTGLVMAGLCLAFGIDFPVLWGVLAFLFNFVPTVGSYISPIPPMILALTESLGMSLGFAAVWVAITTVQGQVVEPAVMGHRLGLSPLIVLLSLMFWNWVLGPVGMVLSLPLTMVVKILLEQDPNTRFVAVLLGPTSVPAEPLPAPPSE
jgi:predicted PurR-regulated permease PerM